MKKRFEKPEGIFMKKIYLLCALIIIFSVAFGSVASSDTKLAKGTVLKDEIFLDANRVSCVFYNNGIWGYNNTTGNWGVEWPKGSGLSPIFGAGQFLGARVNGETRVAGVQHSATEWQPGVIESPGVAANPTDAIYRWYELKENGVGDWNNWPVEQGAPVDETGQPVLLGQQTIFSTWNDLGNHGYYGTNKLGAEVHQTAWAFNRADAIGDMMFIRWKVINKSNDNFEDTYFVIWSDPDVGDAGDDLVGSDSTLGLGYCYNGAASDQNYGGRPPAMGIDFFQGPIVDAPGETVTLPDGTVFENKKQLKMTSFIYYNNDDSNQGNPDTGNDVYNYMRGYWLDGSPITNDGGNGTGDGPKTKFMFSGDPESSDGWLDIDPADRRFMMTTGPFDMEPWVDENGNGLADIGEPGVQVIVAGVLMAMGSNNLNSVTYLKAVDEIAQLAYDIDFDLPSPPKSPRWGDLTNEYDQPTISVSERPNTVVLKWDESSEFIDDDFTQPYSIEDIVANGLIGQSIVTDDGEYKEVTDGTFDFTGYTIYQYADASGGDPVVYATYGPETIENYAPYTGQRHIVITSNKHPKVAPVGQELVNGKEYYFGVQARSYCEFAKPQDFVSPASIVAVVPQNFPGTRYDEEFADMDTVFATYEQIDTGLPESVGSVYAIVVDKSEVTGHTYEITFNDDGTWNLYDKTAGEMKLENQTNQRGDDAYTVIDGLYFKVLGPDLGISSVQELTADGEVADGAVTPFFGASLGSTGYLLSNSVGDINVPAYAADFDRFDYWGTSDVIIDFNETSLTWDYISEEVHVDASTGEPYYAPYSVYRVKFPSGEKQRLFAGFYDRDGSGTWSMPDGLAGPLYGAPSYEDMFAWVGYDAAGNEIVYDPANDAQYIADNALSVSANITWGGSTGEFIYPFLTNTLFTMYADGATPPWGNQVVFYTNKPNNENDIFTIQAPNAPTDSLKHQEDDLKLIKAVPNPYYGYHSGERSLFDRWVQFTNLPEECTITIFDLAGNRVRQMEKNDPTTTLLKWDLKNAYELPVASGVYIYHVDAKGIGEKVGKLAIFAPDERLDTY
jgi:hypothetical protein